MKWGGLIAAAAVATYFVVGAALADRGETAPTLDQIVGVWQVKIHQRSWPSPFGGEMCSFKIKGWMCPSGECKPDSDEDQDGDCPGGLGGGAKEELAGTWTISQLTSQSVLIVQQIGSETTQYQALYSDGILLIGASDFPPPAADSITAFGAIEFTCEAQSQLKLKVIGTRFGVVGVPVPT
jgi:hypothetical protein